MPAKKRSSSLMRRSRSRMSVRGKKSSRRGFAAMSPEEQRRIASMGGRAPHRGPRGFAAMNAKEQREIASMGGRAPHEEPRGFAAMSPREQRQIASMGGRASHGGRGRDIRSRRSSRAISARAA